MSALVLSVLFMTAEHQQHLPAGLLESLCYVETKHDVHAVHIHDGDTNSYGICQIKLLSARQVGFKGTAKELIRPTTNITYAAKYLKHQIKRYHGHLNRGVIAYNMGHAGGLTTTAYQRRVFSVWHKNYLERLICKLTSTSGT